MHTANTLAYFKKSFCFKKYILPWNFKKKMYFSMDFAKKKNHFLYFEILQHVCKNPKGIGQYSKNIKIFFWFIIHCSEFWINKS